MSHFDTLLVLQSHDTALGQLHHRRGHLPQHAEHTSVQEEIKRIDSGIAAVRSSHAQISVQMANLEQQVHELDAKIDALNQQMFGDASRSPRELQAIEADIESIRKHRSTLEDSELELIEEFEPIDAAVQQADTDIARLRARLAELEAEIGQAQQQIDADAAMTVQQRNDVAAGIDPATVQLYESIRKNNRGVGVAKLEHGTCMSCRLKIAAVELDRIAHLPADAMIRCEECGAILVR
jgi:uncharacterized protein